jgi:biopolymer transport protein ExbD
MNFQRKKKEKLELSMTPMIDVVFLLLIFFMVTTTFNRQTEVKVKLPEAVGEEAEQYPKMVTLTIDAKGVYSLKDEDNVAHELVTQTKESLKQALVTLAEHSKDVPFVINADNNTPTKAVITALDVAGQAGFNQITFSTQYPSSEK